MDFKMGGVTYTRKFFSKILRQQFFLIWNSLTFLLNKSNFKTNILGTFTDACPRNGTENWPKKADCFPMKSSAAVTRQFLRYANNTVKSGNFVTKIV